MSRGESGACSSKYITEQQGNFRKYFEFILVRDDHTVIDFRMMMSWQEK